MPKSHKLNLKNVFHFGVCILVADSRTLLGYAAWKKMPDCKSASLYTIAKNGCHFYSMSPIPQQPSYVLIGSSRICTPVFTILKHLVMLCIFGLAEFIRYFLHSNSWMHNSLKRRSVASVKPWKAQTKWTFWSVLMCLIIQDKTGTAIII